MKGRNMIDWVRESGDQKWASWNHTKTDKMGFEAQLHIPLEVIGEKSSLTVNYARMYQDCDSKGLESRYTLNYLRDKLTASLNHKIFGGLYAGWYFRFQDRTGTFRKYENNVDLGLHPYPAFSILDLKLYYEFRKYRINADFNNIFNTSYYDTGNVPQAGFWLICGISVNI